MRMHLTKGIICTRKHQGGGGAQWIDLFEIDVDNVSISSGMFGGCLLPRGKRRRVWWASKVTRFRGKVGAVSCPRDAVLPYFYVKSSVNV